MDVQLNDIVELKKTHPCGSYDWKVVRLGADIGLICLQCNRKILLSRRELSKRVKKIKKRSKELYDDLVFRENMQNLFTSEPTGHLVILTLEDALAKIEELEQRVLKLEKRFSK